MNIVFGVRTALAATTALCCLFVGLRTCVAGTVVYVGADVPAERHVPVERIDHGRWNTLLDKYVDEKGMVDYQSWHKSAADQQALDDYLVHLSAASLSRQADRRVVMAYWINVYNAVTIKGILREYPTSSIRNHTPAFLGYNIWKDLQIRVDGNAYSLEDVEHQVLRKMGDARIHFAIVCASIGCPRLLNRAYTAEKLEEQLVENAKHFFADPTKLQVDFSRSTIHVSPILDWFGDDFGKSSAERLRAIAPYMPTVEARRLAETGRATIKFVEYDWNLNEQGRRSR